MSTTLALMGIPSGTKVCRTDGNVANAVNQTVWDRVPQLKGMRGVHVTGSTVWARVYGDHAFSDLDIMITGNFIQRWWRRRQVVHILKLKYVRETLRYAAARDRVGRVGKKYHSDEHGRVDIWYARRGVIASMMQYPEESYGHCRAALDCETEALVLLPNPRANPEELPF